MAWTMREHKRAHLGKTLKNRDTPCGGSTELSCWLKAHVNHLFAGVWLGSLLTLIMLNPTAAMDLTVSGQKLSGEIIRSTASTVTIKLDSGAMISTAPSEIGDVAIDIPDFGLVEGKFVSWSDGEITVESQSGVVVVKPGGVVQESGAGGPEAKLESDDRPEARALTGPTM